MEWSPEFDEILRRNLPLCTGDVEPDVALADLGLDSLGTVSLVMELEDGLEVSIPDDVLVVETFLTGRALWEVISRLVKEKAHS
jgi:acyl carrier protein